jgi:surfeit locus 1 family protein
MLGTWQIYRYGEKTSYIENTYNNIQLPPKEVQQSAQDFPIFSKIYLEGKVLRDKAMWLYRRHPAAKNKDGAYLIVPVEDIHGNIFLSVIGWVLKDNQEKLLKEIAANSKIGVTGLLLPSEQNSMFLPKNDYKNKICFTLDVKEIAENIGLKMNANSLAVLKLDNKFETQIVPITAEMMVKIKNDHLEYAITWYGLAVALSLIYYLYMNKKYKND